MPADRARAFAELAWYGRGARAGAARAVLAPAAAVYAGITAARNALYDVGVLAQAEPALPTISVGNLSVGGTGKTPVAAWIAGQLKLRGGRPAIVMRGYGEDEPEVHRRLNPDLPVIVDAERVRGVGTAARQGADVAVLDDAFQHRRARRLADVVLISADRWSGSARSLPAGPFREGLGALRRASQVVITRKAASAGTADALAQHIRRSFPALPVSTIHLAPAGLVDARSGADRPLATVAGSPVVAICGVGDPAAFAAQLEAQGAEVLLRAFPDHHAYTDADIAELAAAAARVHARGGTAVCTLKDAVKLSPRWPSGAPALSFLSQQVIVEAGRTTLDHLLDTVIHARRLSADAAG